MYLRILGEGREHLPLPKLVMKPFSKQFEILSSLYLHFNFPRFDCSRSGNLNITTIGGGRVDLVEREGCGPDV